MDGLVRPSDHDWKHEVVDVGLDGRGRAGGQVALAEDEAATMSHSARDFKSFSSSTRAV